MIDDTKLDNLISAIHALNSSVVHQNEISKERAEKMINLLESISRDVREIAERAPLDLTLEQINEHVAAVSSYYLNLLESK